MSMAFILACSGVPVSESLNALLSYMNEHQMEEISGITSLMISPGYRYRLVEGMLTNFHQPRSTLLLLVAAFTGPSWKEAYHYALSHDFRFLSYGDSCLFLK